MFHGHGTTDIVRDRRTQIVIFQRTQSECEIWFSIVSKERRLRIVENSAEENIRS
jgi:hypothetical protein